MQLILLPFVDFMKQLFLALPFLVQYIVYAIVGIFIMLGIITWVQRS